MCENLLESESDSTDTWSEELSRPEVLPLRGDISGDVWVDDGRGVGGEVVIAIVIGIAGYRISTLNARLWSIFLKKNPAKLDENKACGKLLEITCTIWI